MAKKKDAIYEVGDNIRLEDYVEAQQQGGRKSVKYIALLLILGLIGWGAYTYREALINALWGPSYIIAVSTQPITNTNLEQSAQAQHVSPAPGNPVYIRFQWKAGSLNTDLIRIMAEEFTNGSYREVASKSRLLPRTVSYILFMAVFEPGKYRIRVTDRGGNALMTREIEVK